MSNEPERKPDAASEARAYNLSRVQPPRPIHPSWRDLRVAPPKRVLTPVDCASRLIPVNRRQPPRPR